ncbi:Branched-chain-amino-acid aminotransferase, cytosolic [Bagarius yarrelli]|uniref:Branched-chain-amino-acid aminotransferase, mitochondrial n=1 Tax=Bagarius yarrelli TaxID=175774 RepID=A0A556UZL7_BAGYA|nr:Branched-chain-amino-acid aminotransferase, cytosolic [Bagarius yarrelli]
MLTVNWTEKGGWEAPQIKPFQNLSLHPASSALHYSIELFEGMKAFRGVDNQIRLFRPMLNMERMYRSAERCCLPPSLGVSRTNHALLFVIVGPVGPYFATGAFNPVSLLADPRFVRACRGGVGAYKMGRAEIQLSFLLSSERELVTPPLDGIILPGVTRQSLLDLAREWGEFKVTERTLVMKELLEALKGGRVLEVFGAGTACVVCPVGSLLYKGQHFEIPTMKNGPELATRFYKELTDIQYGRKRRDWAPVIVA